MNCKHHKCTVSGQLGYTITFGLQKLHETQITTHQLNNKRAKSFVIGTGAPSSLHLLHLCPQPQESHYTCLPSMLMKSQHIITYWNKVFKQWMKSSNFAAKFLWYALLIIKIANGVFHSAVQHFILKCHMISQYMHKCNFIYAHTKKLPSLHKFSWNSPMFNSIMCRSLILNFTQIWQPHGSYGHKFIYTLKYGFHCTDFHGT
jgi:hypothetical protein